MSNPFTALANFVRHEPAVVTATVATGIGLGAAFGLHLNPTDTKEVLGATNLLAGFVTRSKVSPAAEQVSVRRVADLEAKVAALTANVSPQVAAVVEQASAATAAEAQEAPATPQELVAEAQRLLALAAKQTATPAA